MHVEVDFPSGAHTIYPNMEQDSKFDQYSTPRVVVSHNHKTVSLIHTRQTSVGKPSLVPFFAMSKEEFQKYIDTLQAIHDSMEG